MRAPIRSEADAVRLTLATAVVIALSVLVGWLVEPLVGLIVFGLATIAAAASYLHAAAPDHRPVLREAANAPHPHGPTVGDRHVLVVANTILGGPALRERIVGGSTPRVEVDILAPVLTSRIHYDVSDIDRELDDARARLERSLAWAREHGIAAHGEVGDPSPITALEDELRDFGADEVIVVTRRTQRDTWQERRELARLRQELDVPVTHVELGERGAE